MALARATLSGIVSSDPEKRFTSNNTAVTNFTLEVSPGGKDAPFNVRVTCWRGLAEVAADNLQKGAEATVEGRLQINQYENNAGVSRRIYEVDATTVYLGQPKALFVPGARDGGGNAPSGNRQNGGGYSAPAQNAYSAPQTANSGFGNAPQPDSFAGEDSLTEDDIPF